MPNDPKTPCIIKAVFALFEKVSSFVHLMFEWASWALHRGSAIQHSPLFEKVTSFVHCDSDRSHGSASQHSFSEKSVCSAVFGSAPYDCLRPNDCGDCDPAVNPNRHPPENCAAAAVQLKTQKLLTRCSNAAAPQRLWGLRLGGEPKPSPARELCCCRRAAEDTDTFIPLLARSGAPTILGTSTRR